MIKNNTILITGILFLLSSALTIASPVGAAEDESRLDLTKQAENEEPTPHEHEPTKLQSAEEAEEADLSSAGESKEHQQAVESLGELQERILGNPSLARQFVGAAVGDDGRVTLYLKGKANKDMQSVLQSSGVDLRVVEDGKYNDEELQERADKAHRRLLNAGFSNVMSSYDMTTGEVEVLVSTLGYKGKRPLLSTTAAAAAPAIRGLMSEELQVDLKLEVTDQPVGEDFAHAAVGGMRALDDGVFECTIGWSVREVASPNRTGVTTAGHCGGINQANSPSAFGTVNLTHVRQHRGVWGDIEWKTTSGAERDDFIADQNGNIRDVSSVETIGNLVVGESICVFGRSSNSRDCSQDVRRRSVSCTVSGVTNWRLVEMDSSATTIGGDSGGGWSWSNRAYGSVKGQCGGWNVFSFADYYDEAIGVRVMT